MSTISVYHVTNEEQLKDAYQVRHQVFVDEQKVPEDLEIDQYEEQSEHFVVYQNENEPIGAGRLRPVSSTEAKVERICVLQEVRGQSIGYQIMDKIENVAQKKGIKTLMLHAQDHAKGFYTRLGYETVSEPFDEAGIVHVKMKKEL